MKNLLAILACLVATNAEAMSMKTAYSEADLRNKGLTPIKVDAATCDSDRNPTECTLYVLGNRGKVKRFVINKETSSYTYTTASQREQTQRDASEADITTLLNLGVALEKLGQDCTSILILQSGTPEIVQIQPGCDI